MKFLKTYIMIAIGAIFLIVANSDTLNIPYLFIMGIVFLMFGLYNMSRSIKSKQNIDIVEFNDEEE